MSSGKRIMIFLLLINLVMIIFGFTVDMSPLTEGFGIDVNTTTEDIALPSSSGVLSLLGLSIITGGVVTAVAFAISKDISGSAKLGFAGTMSVLTINTLAVFLTLEDMPFEIRLLVGVVLGVMWIISMIEFVGGTNW